MTGLIHKKGDVLYMVILISDLKVEHGTAELFVDGGRGQVEEPDRFDCLLIGIGASVIEVEVPHRGERLHMQFSAGVGPVEAARHKMRTASFLMQPAVVHRDAGGAGEQIESVFDPAKT